MLFSTCHNVQHFLYECLSSCNLVRLSIKKNKWKQKSDASCSRHEAALKLSSRDKLGRTEGRCMISCVLKERHHRDDEKKGGPASLQDQEAVIKQCFWDKKATAESLPEKKGPHFRSSAALGPFTLARLRRMCVGFPLMTNDSLAPASKQCFFKSGWGKPLLWNLVYFGRKWPNFA